MTNWTYTLNKTYFDRFCYKEKMVTLIRVDLNEFFRIFQFYSLNLQKHNHISALAEVFIMVFFKLNFYKDEQLESTQCWKYYKMKMSLVWKWTKSDLNSNHVVHTEHLLSTDYGLHTVLCNKGYLLGICWFSDRKWMSNGEKVLGRKFFSSTLLGSFGWHNS